jgi:ABC-type nickel/cobalt efflux system permease component RcnA
MQFRNALELLTSLLTLLIGQVALFWHSIAASVLPSELIGTVEQSRTIMGLIATVLGIVAAFWAIRSAKVRIKRDREIIKTKQLEQEELRQGRDPNASD